MLSNLYQNDRFYEEILPYLEDSYFLKFIILKVVKKQLILGLLKRFTWLKAFGAAFSVFWITFLGSTKVPNFFIMFVASLVHIKFVNSKRFRKNSVEKLKNKL